MKSTSGTGQAQVIDSLSTVLYIGGISGPAEELFKKSSVWCSYVLSEEMGNCLILN
jgi:hypothetical protein